MKTKTEEPQGVRYGVLFVRRVPRQLKASFKAHCAKRSKSMRDRLIEHMREDCAKDTV